MQINNKNILIIAASIFIGLILLYGAWMFLSSGKSTAAKPVDIDVSDDSWILGSRDSKVVLVEYSDFQCPACQIYAPLVKGAVEKYKKDIKFVFRHFPLSQHQNAFKASQAAEAAGLQEDFFGMHDLLFERQSDWADEANPDKIFREYAKELNLDLKKFDADYKSSQVKKNIEDDYQQGILHGVDATPSFFLNGIRLQNMRSQQDFEDQIKQSLE